MSHEAVPETHRQTGQPERAGQAGPAAQGGQAAHEDAGRESADPAGGGGPKGLLQQMEELMAALNADLSQLDADLQSPTAGRAQGTPAVEGERPACGPR